ncbi:protein FAR1-related sequence 5 [Tanacetum coccineum]
MDTQNEELFLATSKFESRDELLKSVREFYYAKGYGISISNSRLDKFVILKCDRGGPYRGTQSKDSQRKRSTSSRGVNCPFRITGRKGKDGLWEFRPKNLTHNHDPSSDTNTFVELLNELYLKYQEWPLHKKETATAMISKLINQTDTLFEPAIQRPKRRTPKEKKGTTSTARDPSRFEYVESSQTHNPSSSSNVVQRSNEVVGEQRDAEVVDLKVMLERSEAEAAEVVELRKRVSDLEAVVAIKTGEVANLNTQNAGLLEKVSALELVCRELYGKVSQLTANCDGLKSRVVGEEKMQEEFVSQQDATERRFAERLRSWMPALLM